jgi:hypothetical protein
MGTPGELGRVLWIGVSHPSILDLPRSATRPTATLSTGSLLLVVSLQEARGTASRTKSEDSTFPGLAAGQCKVGKR